MYGPAAGCAKAIADGERSCDEGNVIIEQVWPISVGNAIKKISEKCVGILAGKAHFLPPGRWSCIPMPYRVIMTGCFLIMCALSKEGLIAGLTITNGGHLRLNIFNSLDEPVYIGPKTVMLHLRNCNVQVKKYGGVKVANVENEWDDIAWAENIEREVREKYPKVGDLSEHPITPAMQELEVQVYEAPHVMPKEMGSRTEYKVENVTGGYKW